MRLVALLHTVGVWRGGLPCKVCTLRISLAYLSELTTVHPEVTWYVNSGDVEGDLTGCIPSDITRDRFHSAGQA